MCTIRCASHPVSSSRQEKTRIVTHIARCNGMSRHTSPDSPRMATHCPAATCALSSSATGSTDGRPSLSSCDSTEAFFPIASLSCRDKKQQRNNTQYSKQFSNNGVCASPPQLHGLAENQRSDKSFHRVKFPPRGMCSSNNITRRLHTYEHSRGFLSKPSQKACS